MCLWFNTSGMDPDDYIRKYDNEQFIKFVQQDKQSFVLFKVKMYQMRLIMILHTKTF